MIRAACLLAVLLPLSAQAHGVVSEILPGPATVVAVRYADGSPLAFARYEIYPPAEDGPFQVGRTDRHGRVAFAPDRQGEWRVKVMTNDGHGTTATVPVDKDLMASVGGSSPPGTASKIITGVGVLLGVFGLFALYQQRRMRS